MTKYLLRCIIAKKKEEDIMLRRNEEVHIDNIEVGFVGQVDGNINVLRKIMFARILDEDRIGGLNCPSRGYIYTTPTGSKIEVDDFKKGVDLCERIRGKNIIYPVKKATKLSTELGADNIDGNIIIFQTIEVGNFLRYVGFPLHLDRRNLQKARNILLKREVPIIRQQTPVARGSFEKFDSLENFDVDQFNQMKEILTPLLNYKSLGNTSSVTPEEKVFAKSKKYM